MPTRSELTTQIATTKKEIAKSEKKITDAEKRLAHIQSDIDTCVDKSTRLGEYRKEQYCNKEYYGHYNNKKTETGGVKGKGNWEATDDSIIGKLRNTIDHNTERIVIKQGELKVLEEELAELPWFSSGGKTRRKNPRNTRRKRKTRSRL